MKQMLKRVLKRLARPMIPEFRSALEESHLKDEAAAQKTLCKASDGIGKVGSLNY